MEDIEVPDDAADAPDSPDSEEESSASEETADAEDAAQAEGAEEKPAEGEETDEGSKPDSAKGRRGKAYESLLKKYGGDEEKMAAAYYEQANSNSQLHQRLKSIEDYIRGQQEAPVDEAKLVAEDPDVTALNEELAEVQAQYRATTKELNATISEYGTAEKLVARLEGKLEAADPDVAIQIRQDLAQAKADSKRLEAAARAGSAELKRMEKEARGLQRQIKGAEQEARAKISRQRQVKLEKQQEAQGARLEFVAAMQEKARSIGMDLDSKTYKLLFTSARDRMLSYLASLPEDSPGVSIPDFVSDVVDEYVEGMELKGKFQNKSALKRATIPGKANGSAVTRPTGEVPAKTKMPTSAADFRARAKRMLG